MSQRVGVYPGTFDPVTNGHMDIIQRATRVLDHLIVGVARNAGKGPLFSTEERVQMVEEDVAALKPNGTKIEIAVSKTGWVIRARIGITMSATSKPTATPPKAAMRKPMLACVAVTVPAMAAIATRRQVIAVASLTSDSPSRIVTRRRGSPTRRAIVVAAMASGGATTAPKANATGKLTGKISQVIRPTPKAVTTTSSTESCAMDRRLARKSITEVRMAAAYSNGGRNPISTSSEVSSGM